MLMSPDATFHISLDSTWTTVFILPTQSTANSIAIAAEWQIARLFDSLGVDFSISTPKCFSIRWLQSTLVREMREQAANTPVRRTTSEQLATPRARPNH